MKNAGSEIQLQSRAAQDEGVGVDGGEGVEREEVYVTSMQDERARSEGPQNPSSALLRTRRRTFFLYALMSSRTSFCARSRASVHCRKEC